MSVTHTVECTKCGVAAPEIGDFGYIGAPSLDLKSKRGGSRSFGVIYAACAAAGLLSEELEGMKAFLEAHRGHRIVLLEDGVAVDDNGDEEGDETGARPFRWKKGTFVDAFHVVHCPKCEQDHRSSVSVPLRPFKERVPTAADLATFFAGTADLDQHIYRAGPPFDAVDDLRVFLKQHKNHGVSVALDRGSTSPKRSVPRPGKALATRMAPWTEADDERRLTPPRDPGLWDALRGLRNADVGVRRSSISLVLQSTDQQAFGYVASMLNDPDAVVRRIAATALGIMDDRRRLAPLGRATLDHDAGVRGAAQEALVRAGLLLEDARRAAVAPTHDAPTAPKPTGKTDRDIFSPIVKTRAAAVDSLRARFDAASQAWLSKALADPCSVVRGSAASVLGVHLKTTPTVAPLLLCALDDYSISVLLAAIRASAHPNGAQLVSRLETLLQSGKDLIREECIEALTAIGSEAAQRALLRLTDHENEYIRQKAAASLTRMKPVHLVPELTAAMSHADERVAALASSALATLPLNLVLPILVDAFRHQPKMRLEILAALEPRNDKSLKRLFLAGLRDRSKYARMRAARWFARRGDADSNAALIAAARRGDGAVASVVWRFLLAAGVTGTEAGLEKAFADVDDPDLMAASFIHSGNRTLAAAARRRSSWQPKTFPRIKWGRERGK